MREIKRGEIYYANLCPVIGSEQSGVRPVIILQNNTGNHYSPTTIVAAITSKETKVGLPTHVKVTTIKHGFWNMWVALTEQIWNR